MVSHSVEATERMAHELLIDGGRAAMFYVNEVPWHRLGTPLKAPPTSREAIEAAGLDWTVAKAPLHVVGQYRLHVVAERFALLRQDRIGQPDCRIFGIAGRDYRVLQNRDAFAFFDPLVEGGKAAYETAGALGHGERIWILARLKGDLDVAGDKLQRFLLLSNNHDGRASVQVKLTPVRVVCNNTLTLALSGGDTIAVRHDRDLSRRLEEAKKLLGLVDRRYAELEELFKRLAATELTRKRALQYFADVSGLSSRPQADGRRGSTPVGSLPQGEGGAGVGPTGRFRTDGGEDRASTVDSQQAR